MADQEDEIKSLTEKNAVLVQEVQRWKMTAAQRENEKLELMKEINELRLKVIRLKSGSAADAARKLEAALQSASEQALSHLVHASSAVTRTIELAKTYMRDREGPEVVSPRWSSISNSTEKVHRVPPLMMGGQSIQPVVSLSRATLNFNTARPTVRSPNSNRNPTLRAVPIPMRMLQDVYIPLTRIDVRDIPTNADTDPDAASNHSGEDGTLHSSMEEAAEDSQNVTEDENFDTSVRLDVVTEDPELESEEQTPPRLRRENPLEGPSWLLDVPRPVLEPDSTTEESAPPPHTPEAVEATPQQAPASPELCRVFAPTLRRRKRTRSPPRSPARDSLNSSALCSRVLQVLLPKLPAGAGAASPPPRGGAPPPPPPRGAASPPPRKRLAAPRFDAPSPNGTTDSCVIVLEELETESTESQSGEPSQHQSPVTKRDKSHRNDQSHTQQHESRQGSYRRDSGDSDRSSEADRVGEGRTRRKRKPVTYKEKPLNRKLRR